MYSADTECLNCSYVVSNLVKACTQYQNLKRITVTSIRTITNMMATVPMEKDMLPEIGNLLLLLLQCMSYNTGSNYIHCTKVLFVIMIIHVHVHVHVHLLYRSTMIEQRLNNLLLLNTHKKETDALDLVEIANSFVSTIERQLNLLESFYIKIICFMYRIIIIYFFQSLSSTMFVTS